MSFKWLASAAFPCPIFLAATQPVISFLCVISISSVNSSLAGSLAAALSFPFWCAVRGNCSALPPGKLCVQGWLAKWVCLKVCRCRSDTGWCRSQHCCFRQDHCLFPSRSFMGCILSDCIAFRVLLLLFYINLVKSA